MEEKKETKKIKILRLLDEGKTDAEILSEVHLKNPRYLQAIKGNKKIETE